MKQLYFKVVMVVLILAVGCMNLCFGQNNEERAEADVLVGSIKGYVKFEGEIPPSQRINMASDPICEKSNSREAFDESVVVGEGGELANVIVYIDDIDVEVSESEGTYVLDQKDCMYRPHVMAIPRGRELEIRNSDKTLHNVHCYKGQMTCFSRVMFHGMEPIQHKFQEVGLKKFVSNVHPWMTAYVYVTKNHFFDITVTDGSFEIENVPVGEYTLKAWHEKFGELSAQVSVTAGAESFENFTFTSPEIEEFPTGERSGM